MESNSSIKPSPIFDPVSEPPANPPPPPVSKQASPDTLTPKIVLVAGIILTIGCIALCIFTTNHPQLFGDYTHIVKKAVIGGSVVFGIATIAYGILNKKASQIEERERERAKESSQEEDKFNSTFDDPYKRRLIREKEDFDASDITTLVSDQKDWDARLKVGCNTTHSDQRYHNLAESTSPIAKTSFGGRHLRVPHLGEYGKNNPCPPVMGVKLPSDNIKGFPSSVRKAVGQNQNVDVLFLVFKDIEQSETYHRNILLQPQYMVEGGKEEHKKVEAAIFEPSNIYKERTTHPQSGGIRIGDFKEMEVEVHKQGAWSQDNMKIQLRQADTSSFYLVTKCEGKTTVSHIVILQKDDELNKAIEHQTVGEFLKGVEAIKDQTLKGQIQNEFAFHDPFSELS